jgi:hypothetical protein
MQPKDRPPIKNRRSVERRLKAHFLPRLQALADRESLERADIIHTAIVSYERSRVKIMSGGYTKPINETEFELIEIVTEAVNLDTDSKDTEKPKTRRTLKDPHQALYYSQLLIDTFQEVLDYDPVRSHNRPAPNLRLENPEYLDFIRELVTELRKLNSLLVKNRRSSSETRTTVLSLSKHFNKFLSSYAGAMGKVAAGLTGGAIVSLLYHMEVSKEVIDGIWRHLRLPN